MRRKSKTRVLEMKKIKEILRLKSLGLSQTKIAQGANVSRSTVQDYLGRAEVAGVDYSAIESLEDSEISKLLGKQEKASKRKAKPDYHYIRRELSKKNVTLSLLWQEYLSEHPEGLSYSQFCESYRKWKKSNKLSMRQVHKAGERLFVDYTGHTIPIYRRGSNEVLFNAQIFVGVLGASNYTFAEATPSQESKHWLSSHRRCFEYLGGVPEIVVPDNLKSGVTKASFYEPSLNPGYKELAEHYGVAVLPARVRKPKDKAKVEVGVQIVERWILAVFRNRKFFSLAELNNEMARMLEALNNKQMKSYGCSRKELFESTDKPFLQDLPSEPYQFFDLKIAKVNIDYHVEVDKHYYSVPHQLVHQEVEVRIKEQLIEIFYGEKLISMHPRSQAKFKHSTKREHMPASSFRSCLGLLRLEKKFGTERLEAACKRANQLGITSYKRIKSILDNGMDRLPIVELKSVEPVRHENIRGSNYYH